MTTYRLCRHCGDFHDISDWPDNHRDPEPARSALAAPMISTDTMPETEHVDGKYYTSKSAYRRVTRERGYEEVGNDPARLRPRKKAVPKKDELSRSLKQAEAIVKSTTPTRDLKRIGKA